MTAPIINTAGSFYYRGLGPIGLQYDTAVHSCHFPQAVAILAQSTKDGRGEAKLKAFPNKKKHQIFDEESRHLLFFGATNVETLDEEEPNRYGPVILHLTVKDLISQYATQFGMPQILILGTSKYKNEYSHKILVSSFVDPRFEELEVLPSECLEFTWRDWVLSPSPRTQQGNLFEQWEFVLDLGPTTTDVPTLTLPVTLAFAAHNGFCVPAIKEDITSLQCSPNYKWNPTRPIMERRTKSAIESKIEFCFYLLNQGSVGFALNIETIDTLANELKKMKEVRLVNLDTNGEQQKINILFPHFEHHQRCTAYRSCYSWRHKSKFKLEEVDWIYSLQKAEKKKSKVASKESSSEEESSIDKKTKKRY